MKLEGERWRTLVSAVRLGRDEYRVVRPARPLTHAPLYLSGRGTQAGEAAHRRHSGVGGGGLRVGNALRTLVEECPRHMHENPGTHCCAEISAGEVGDWLHVIYCAEHRVHG